MMKKLNEKQMREVTGGAKVYSCPWNDYNNRSYWSTYGHAISCAYRRGWFNIPIGLIKAGIGMR